MFTNEQLRNEEFKLKPSKSRASYFRLYNQKPHRQVYLKTYSQTRRLVAKYNPLYQDKRKEDRHKLTRQSRYQLSLLTKELSKRGWEVNSNFSQTQKPYLFFKVALVDKKFGQTSYVYRSLYFLHACENLTQREKQEAYQFAYLVQKEGEQLSELLVKKPLLFRKRLKEIEKTVQVVGQHWGKKDVVRTINQIPQERGWQLSSCWEKQDLGALLLKYQEAGGKNKLVLDFDHYKRDSEGEYLMGEGERKEVDLVIDYLINYWKLPWYEVSKSGARKLHLNVDELPMKSKLWWKGLVIGDVLGKGSQTTLPLSKGRRVEFSKWSWMGVRLPLIKLKSWENDLGRFSLRGNGGMIVRDFAKVERKENNFLSTNTTFDKAKWEWGVEPNLSTNATLKKELGYYGVREVKLLKVFTPKLVERLSSTGGSRESCYYRVDYLGLGQQRGSFLVDKGWREREFRRVVGGLASRLVLKIGESVEFLVGCYLKF